MDDLIYRFRPISRLLHEDGISGELDSQYIYFAGTNQLNDPMEGYKDVFFAGDQIVWMNLLRNYLQCLTRHCVNLSFDPSAPYELSEYVLDVMSEAPQEVVDMCDSVIEDFLSEPIISRFVSTWHALGEASLSELYNYLDVIHLPALEAITKALLKAGFISSASQLNETKQAERLQRIKNYTDALSVPDLDYQEKKVMMGRYVQANKERQLFSRCRDYDRKELPASYYEMIAFPDKYCAALEKSIYPEWYVACFMEDCDDSSIWGSYGGNHKDVCLEFQVERSAGRHGMTLSGPNGYNGNGHTWSKNMMLFEPVSYGKEFARVDFFNSLGALNTNSIYRYWYNDSEGRTSDRAKQLAENNDVWRANYWQGFLHSATVKVSDWHKEREFRLIQTTSIFDFSDPNLRKLTYDFSSLTGIVFGIKTSMEDKCQLIARIKQLCEVHKREFFSFYQARYDHTSKKIAKDVLSTIQVGFKREL